jgi:hypothetical protein
MNWHDGQWAIIEPIVNLTIVPFLSDPLANLYSKICRNTDQAGVEKPMKVGAKKEPVPDIMTALS